MQLSTQSTGTSKALNELYSCHRDGQQPPTTEKLIETLKEIIGNFHQTYIILDALDECAEREELLVLIKDMAEWNIRKLHIMATSRREKDIEEALESLVTDQICIQTALVNPDIQLHIRERLQHDRKLKWPPEIQKEIEETLMQGAHGMYV